MSIQYKVSPRAYALPILHAAKYSSSTVCGVLLGKVDAQEVEVVSAIPFFHHWTALTPMLETALQQAEIYATLNDLKIVGWYQANEHDDDVTVHDNAIKVTDLIRQRIPQAVIFIVDDRKTDSSDKKESSILPYIFSENQWRANKLAFTKESNFGFTYEETVPKVRGLFSTSAYNKVVDFDDHLEDVSLDWFTSPELKI
ncbi:hypothetical protein J3Q64DRAFT_1259629 [Phycomyces blakesleeanus]|uniref:MPN domain-containing protein n=2 Tax=Phycomyces blakesleeanus TaxID=4837 RepID=A0A162N5U0_PHYB8|nr:hypothetical protein PHYBLDRAFT_137493 [Phycomyces blakesleeanus NRRL 1555(-)]OAD66074.1 hypothetical protein PHYBLDRAFT_137493 [Phycomyces blakesleeanus NRRL 1555(-)]|eukprot:XP_018284114.1 hypothetical protein PHYBLDRAFT_137493 [Phycomyces blakesleeanus NRRL 1555(-)]